MKEIEQALLSNIGNKLTEELVLGLLMKINEALINEKNRQKNQEGIKRVGKPKSGG